jgi:hypothetical protein
MSISLNNLVIMNGSSYGMKAYVVACDTEVSSVKQNDQFMAILLSNE